MSKLPTTVLLTFFPVLRTRSREIFRCNPLFNPRQPVRSALVSQQLQTHRQCNGSWQAVLRELCTVSTCLTSARAYQMLATVVLTLHSPNQLFYMDRHFRPSGIYVCTIPALYGRYDGVLSSLCSTV